MKYVERSPPHTLAHLIECLWVASDRPRRSRRSPDRILPDGCPEWIVHVGDPFERRVGERWVRQPGSFLAGTLSRPWEVRGGARVATLGIRFKPGGAAVLLDLDLTRTADREIVLADRKSEPGARLIAAVRSAGTPSKMLAAAHAALCSLAADRVFALPVTRRAVDRIVTSEGRVRIETLARQVHMSRRTLERAFQRELGISPKRYARIVRFNVVLASVATAERARLIELALAAGYFDEAHLLRDFRVLAGRKPRGTGDADGELARYFTRVERLRKVLDPR